MRRILVTFSIYEPQIGRVFFLKNIFIINLGYVQGMNFLAGNLLYHSEEFVAFWLFVMLFEMFELRDIYLPSFGNYF